MPSPKKCSIEGCAHLAMIDIHEDKKSESSFVKGDHLTTGIWLFPFTVANHGLCGRHRHEQLNGTLKKEKKRKRKDMVTKTLWGE